uniref:Uncharacterized protein n=1 Tax=viral metagenome TaxID=1070528 RepID=A0A6C0H8K9_9ZZZZ
MATIKIIFKNKKIKKRFINFYFFIIILLKFSNILNK